jgi:hypothetical protein
MLAAIRDAHAAGLFSMHKSGWGNFVPNWEEAAFHF